MHLQYDQAKMNRCSDLFLSLFYSIFFSSSQLSLALTVATSQMLMFFFFSQHRRPYLGQNRVRPEPGRHRSLHAGDQR